MKGAKSGLNRHTGMTGRADRMIRHTVIGSALVIAQAFGLVGCGLTRSPAGPAQADLRAEMLRGDKPTGPEGACWASDETPAVIETITDQIAEPATDQSDAGYRTETRQKIVRPREKIWFRTPCEAALTPDVVATLQRALAARGHYVAPVNGVLDAATKSAIRAFQTPRGLNSDRLSLTAARELGVIASDFGDGAAAT